MTRADVHRLVDDLPEESLEAAARWLASARDPAIAHLDATLPDDDPFTDDERQAVYRALLRLDGGDVVPLGDVRAELDQAG